MLQSLIAVFGVIILLGVWLAVQRIADQVAAERCAGEPESERHPLPDTCAVCGGTCRARIHTPSRAETKPTPPAPAEPSQPDQPHI